MKYLSPSAPNPGWKHITPSSALGITATCSDDTTTICQTAHLPRAYYPTQHPNLTLQPCPQITHTQHSEVYTDTAARRCGVPHSPMASTSSMKMMVGSWSRAYANISRITRALSPMYLSTIALETTFKKLASTFDATARANNVLPVPRPRRTHQLGEECFKIGRLSGKNNIGDAGLYKVYFG